MEESPVRVQDWGTGRSEGGVYCSDSERPDEKQPQLARSDTLGMPTIEFVLQVLRIHISTESDLLFLHTLEVTEDDFQGLKAEQGILVDFSHFPGKLITLLEKCIHACNDEFQAELTTTGAASCLRIVETNDFNKLPHVSLKFRPGSDQAVKSFLAFRLSEVEEKSESLESQLTQSHVCQSQSVRFNSVSFVRWSVGD